MQHNPYKIHAQKALQAEDDRSQVFTDGYTSYEICVKRLI